MDVIKTCNNSRHDKGVYYFKFIEFVEKINGYFLSKLAK